MPEIKILWPRASRLFVFQSNQQIILFAVVACVTYGVLDMLPLSAQVKSYAFCGALGGIITWIALVLPSCIRWQLSDMKSLIHAKIQLGQWIEDMGYTVQIRPGVYTQNVPAWARGDNVVFLTTHELTLEVSGPWMTIRFLQSRARSLKASAGN